MGYLGLDETTIKDDNLFQRMFWPSDHAGESDTLGQQGFWVCTAIAVFSFALLLVQGHWLIGLFTFAFYFLGGMGVREHSQPAAILVAAAYVLEEAIKLFAAGMPPGGIDLVITLLLLANIRGTWIAAKWAGAGHDEAMPERMNATLTDKLVDQLPPRVWPKAKVPFFVLAGVYVLVGVLLAVASADQAPAKWKRSGVQDVPAADANLSR